MNSQIINLTNEIKGLLDHKRKLEPDVNIIKNSNDKLVKRINGNERHCWENLQQLRRNCWEVVGIPTPVSETAVEDKACHILRRSVSETSSPVID